MSLAASLRACARLALVAATVMFAMFLAARAGGGVTQQHFERAFEPARWNLELAQAAHGTLPWVLFLDNLFVVLFSTCLVWTARALHVLRPHLLAAPVAVAFALVGLLDFAENVHLQVGLWRLAEDPTLAWASAAQIEFWSVLSLMKWQIAYAAIFGMSFLLPGTTALQQVLIWSLRLVLLPAGIAAGVLAEADATLLELLRFLLMFGGYVVLAVVLARLARREPVPA